MRAACARRIWGVVMWVVMVCMPFGLAQGTPLLGTYLGNGCDGLKRVGAFSEWLGREPDFMLDFFAFDSWQSMMDDANWTVKCWRRANTTVIFSVPMLAKGSTLAQGAAGDFDEYFRKIATLLVENRYGDAIIRLGWEFNGGWYPWAAKQDPENWVKYWQRIVTIMRGVPGAKFRFDWCTAQGWQQIQSDRVYPGDEYVDIIGQDLYNQTWTKGVTTPEQRWNELVTQSYGLNWLAKFAREHNKPMSFPEWGTGNRSDGHGGGDDAQFIANMTAWIRSNNVLYHSYWDYPARDYNAKLSDGSKPLAGARFLQLFGAHGKETRP